MALGIDDETALIILCIGAKRVRTPAYRTLDITKRVRRHFNSAVEPELTFTYLGLGYRESTGKLIKVSVDCSNRL